MIFCFLDNKYKIMQITLRDATIKDLNNIASCQRKAFPYSFSSSLGIKYLAKMLEWFLVTPGAFLFLCEENGECIGYCGGYVTDGKQRMGSASGMTQYSFKEAVKAIAMRPWLLLHKEVLNKLPFIKKNLLIKLGLARPVKPASTQDIIYPRCGLIVIGVNPDHQGKGIGSKLIAHFEKISKDRGVNNVYLTAKSSNLQAINAYKRNGWAIANAGQSGTLMIKHL
jgi:ribosomal protein S18 acetylase RimI-like enzyme